jgi:hypothetical protein
MANLQKQSGIAVIGVTKIMKLLALRCPQCAHALAPHHDDVVVMGCPNCRTAVRVDVSGLNATEIQYATPAKEQIDAWLPFWLFNGQVHIERRTTQGSNRRARQQSEQLWGAPRCLYVPAWNLSMHDACEMGSHLVQQQPTFQAIPQPEGALVEEATMMPDDALKFLEFVVLTVEAQRKDWLKDIKFHIEADPPQLWAVPAQRSGNGWTIIPRT